MSERKPLTVLQNGCVARRACQKTYGKKGKAPAASGSQNFFTMTDNLEKKMERFNISDDNDFGVRTLRPAKTIRPGKKSVKEKERADGRSKEAPKTAIRVKEDPSATTSKSPEDCGATRDQEIIAEFVKEHSNQKVLPFNGYGNTIGQKYEVKKIGEGSYSSVFALVPKDSPDKTSPNPSTTIIKLMPILLPSQGTDEEGMTAPCHIASELQTMKVMDAIHGFIRYRGVVVVKGLWPQSFAQAFRRFAAKNKEAVNEDPETAFDSAQYYALIEMEDAGEEINIIRRPSDFQMFDIFWSTCIHLANAESLVQFEHRDLHVSNICFKSTDTEYQSIDIDEEIVDDMIEKPKIILGLSNLSITLIDYTFSRVTITSQLDSIKSTNSREFDLDSDRYEELAAEYDGAPVKNSAEMESRFQSLTYAKVAKMVLENKEEEGEEIAGTSKPTAPWERHVPRTNVCWLSYLICCLLQRAGKVARTKYVVGSNALAKTLQDEIRAKLVALRECLWEDDLEKMPRSAADVVRIGVERGWLSKEEIEAFKARLEEDS